MYTHHSGRHIGCIPLSPLEYGKSVSSLVPSGKPISLRFDLQCLFSRSSSFSVSLWSFLWRDDSYHTARRCHFQLCWCRSQPWSASLRKHQMLLLFLGWMIWLLVWKSPLSMNVWLFKCLIIHPATSISILLPLPIQRGHMCVSICSVANCHLFFVLFFWHFFNNKTKVKAILGQALAVWWLFVKMEVQIWAQ